MRQILIILLAFSSFQVVGQKLDSTSNKLSTTPILDSTVNSVKDNNRTIDIYEAMIKSQDRTITNLELLVTILGLIVGIISFSLPIAIYFFQIRPAEKILNEVKNVDSKIETRLKDYLKTEETKRIDNAILQLQSPDEKTSSEAAMYLSFNPTFDFSEAHLAKIYITLKSDIDFSKKSILLMILSKRHTAFADEYFLSMIKSETDTQLYLYYCIRYFHVSGIDNYLNTIGEYILTANNVSQNVNSITNNYIGVAATLLSISKKSFVTLVNYQILNNGLDVAIRKNIVTSLEHSVKMYKAETELKTSILARGTK